MSGSSSRPYFAHTSIRRCAHSVSLLVQDMVIKRALQAGRDLRLSGDFRAERFFDLGGDPVGVAEQDTGGNTSQFGLNSRHCFLLLRFL